MAVAGIEFGPSGRRAALSTMLPTEARGEGDGGAAVGEAEARAGGEGADWSERNAEAFGEGEELLGAPGRGGEEQLVIVARGDGGKARCPILAEGGEESCRK